MSSELKAVMRQLDDLTREGHYESAMALVLEARSAYSPESAEGKELQEALTILTQMAEMAQFAQELGVGPGGSHVQEYSPDWVPPKQ